MGVEEQYARFTLLQWGILIVPTASAFWFLHHSSIPKNWQDLVIYSMLLFSALIAIFRPDWHKTEFWQSLSTMFVLHAFVFLIFGEAWPRTNRIPKLTLSAVILVETMLMLVFIWKKTHQGRRDS
jgi:hypothetical protein